MGEDYATAAAFAEDVFASGNFGAKDADGSIDSVFVTAYTDSKKKRRGISRAFSAANAIVRRHWSAAEKCPLLYPVGWVYFTLRYVVRRITGRNKVRVFKSYKRSVKRVELYDSLRIFEPET